MLKWIVRLLGLATILMPVVVYGGVTKQANRSTVKPGEVVQYNITYDYDLRTPTTTVNIGSSTSCPASNPNADIIISGANTVVTCGAGTYRWRSLKITSGAVLTETQIAPSSGPTNNLLEIFVAKNVELSGGGKIDVSGKGYGGGSGVHASALDCSGNCRATNDGYGPGGGIGAGHTNSCIRADAMGGGGSHGGKGGETWKTGGYPIPADFGKPGSRPPYGNSSAPVSVGSGGAGWLSHHEAGFIITVCKNDAEEGGAGGGAVHIKATRVSTGGGSSGIFAKGTPSPNGRGGSGAGGSIWLQVAEPSGGQTFSVSGGTGTGAGHNGQPGQATIFTAAGPGLIDARGGDGWTGGGGGYISIMSTSADDVATSVGGGAVSFNLRDILPDGFVYQSATPSPTGTACGSLGPQAVCWNNSVIDPDGDGRAQGSLKLFAIRSQVTAGCGQPAVNQSYMIVTQNGQSTPMPAAQASVLVDCEGGGGSGGDLTLNAPATAATGPIRVNWSITKTASEVRYVASGVCPGSATLIRNVATQSGSFDVAATALGTCTVTVYAVFPSGTVSKSVSININQATAGPTLSVSAPVAVVAGTRFNVTWTQTGATAMNYALKSTGGPFPNSIVCSDLTGSNAGVLVPNPNGTLVLDTNFNTGTCEVTIIASRGSANVSKTVSIIITPAPPVIDQFYASNTAITRLKPNTTLFYVTNRLQSGDSLRIRESCDFGRSNIYNPATGSGNIVVSFPVSIAQNGTCTYTLEVVRGGVVLASRALSINVNIAPILTSCGLLVCFSYDAKAIILPPPGFTRIIKPFISEVAP